MKRFNCKFTAVTDISSFKLKHLKHFNHPKKKKKTLHVSVSTGQLRCWTALLGRALRTSVWHYPNHSKRATMAQWLRY